MHQHQQRHQNTKGGRPEWLARAHEKARREAWLGACGQKPDQIETREEMKGDNVVAIIVESRVDLTVPAALKDRLKAVFVKANTEVTIYNQAVDQSKLRSRVLVLVFKTPQNGITGLPVTPAEGRKLRKEGYTHVVITSVPEGARQREQFNALMEGRYDESGWWAGFYKPKGGHCHGNEKGGELVRDFQSELCVLQYLYENDLLALYEVPLLTSWGFLPKTDEAREQENAATAAIQLMLGRPGRLNAEQTYHRARLLERFRDLYAYDEEELEQKVQTAFAATVVGNSALQRIEDGTSEARTYYLSADNSLAYAIHNTGDGQYVVKIDLRSKSVDVGLTKCDLNGLELMGLYDEFLTSDRFRQVSWHEFTAYTTGVGLVNLNAPS